ncbi:MAG: hypothetical protein A2128_01015 [Candidatus Liptonbacteria bacterium GWC1_60_9]|uniref:Uncharacterized protein n=2 Tax=Candidatus Liptoniibacteriota TaxID=1817909 RepID=A0A1G2C7S2_9BACT|nr:MAG: hypothetical protein A2128_01015 [Candidatus Liptonbacteria bacterium GWC1_60_9]
MNGDEAILKSFLERVSGFSLFGEEDKSMWRSRAEHLSPEIMVFLARLFEESPEDIVRINENVKTKEEILASLDHARWQELLAKEKAHLESLS